MNNIFPSPLTERLAHDIRKFGRVLKTVKPLEGVFAPIPTYALLLLFGHPKDFVERMCICSPCFIFGTGNQTPFVAQYLRSWWTLHLNRPLPLSTLSVHPPNVRKERVFKNPRVFACSNMTPAASQSSRDVCIPEGPPNISWQRNLKQAGNVTFLLGRDRVTKQRTVLRLDARSSSEPQTAEFNLFIPATDACNARTILEKQAS
ncbi:hypothetical protein EDB83DRAFT_1936631 [Lactarius deliciosus]|nr:hypothetical protein EDB83DRAFT_1936631 [Lactarius deliciosus]